MATFAELKTEISDLLLDPSNTAISAATVATAINNAISYWKFRRFWFNTANDTATLTIDSDVIPLPSDFLVEMPDNDGFVIDYSNSRFALVKVAPREFDDIYDSNGKGMPSIYSLKGSTYSCYSIPNQAFTIRRYYLKTYANLSADGDTNDFTNNASDLIKYWALSKLHYARRQDDKMGQYYTDRAMDEYNNLQIRSSKANATGYLQIDSFL